MNTATKKNCTNNDNTLHHLTNKYKLTGLT